MGTALPVFLAQVAKDLFDTILLLDGLVEAELELRHTPEAQPAPDLPAEKGGGAFERERRLPPCLRVV